MFVIGIRPADRAVVIGPREELLGNGVVARELNWLADAPDVGSPVSVRVRHHSAAAPAEIIRLDGDEIELALDQPVSAITPGQSLVIYQGQQVIGGGVIEAGTRAVRAALPVVAA
jgi:tRNA-specific 2-thiouridylase